MQFAAWCAISWHHLLFLKEACGKAAQLITPSSEGAVAIFAGPFECPRYPLVFWKGSLRFSQIAVPRKEERLLRGCLEAEKGHRR